MANHDSGQIVQKLSEILRSAECPLCHSKEFVPLRPFVINTLCADENSGPMVLSETLPCVSMICSNCGLVTQHSVNVLLRKLHDGK